MAQVALDPAYRRVSVAEFLGIDFGDAKAELEDGIIFMMTGGTPAHSRVTTNILIALGVRLRGSGCRPYNSDLGVRTGEQSVRYPDASVYCNTSAVSDSQDTKLIGDPRLVVEVLSPSTSSLDQKVKREEYLALPGITDIVFIDPVRERVRHVRRSADEWLAPGADLVLAALGVTIPHAEIFED